MSSQDEQRIGGSQQGGGLHGRFDYLLDAKKRFSVPADWRDAMGSPDYVYVLPDPAMQYLHLLPPEEMERTFEVLRHRDLFEGDLDASLGLINEYVDKVWLDGQGRIRVNDQLLNHAMIEDTIVMIGTRTRAQLWSLKLRPATSALDQDAFEEAYRTFKKCKSQIESRKR